MDDRRYGEALKTRQDRGPLSGWARAACALAVCAGVGLAACQKSQGTTTKEDPNQDAAVGAAASSTPESGSAASDAQSNPAGSR